MNTAAANQAPTRATGADPGSPLRGPVSGFFRDPQAFGALAALVPALFADKGPDESVRVWVTGCATGEEAFSIAILLREHAATMDSPPGVEMFATDTDARGCARGRTALYPASAVACLPAARLSRFFVWEGGGYRVAKAVREGVLFAGHDVLRDPPFTRLDLVSCRGLLTGLPDEARARVMATFHDALVPGGLLFLGAGEDPGGDGRWTPAAGAHPVYRRDGAPPRTSAAPDGETSAHPATGSRT